MNAKAIAVALLSLAVFTAWLLLLLRDRGAMAPAGRSSLPQSTAGAPDDGPGRVSSGAEAEVVLDRSVVAEVPVAPLEEPATTVPLVVVRGRLVDGNGAPRSGIGVQITSWSLPDATDRDDLVFDSGRGAPRRPRPTSTTDGEGVFRLSLAVGRSGELSLPDGDLTFAGEAPRVDGKAGDQDLGDVVVDRAGILQGVVLDQNGHPVAGVGVAATCGVFPFRSRSSTTTAADGTFTVGCLRAGTWTLRTSSERFLPTVERLTLEREQRRSDLILSVHPGRAVAGQVIDDRGQPLAGIRVQSARQQRGAGALDHLEVAATVTDEHGSFTLAGLGEPVVTVRAFGPGHTGETVADVAVGTSDLLIRLERLAVVEGTLSAPDGAPIAGSTVAALPPGASDVASRPELLEVIQLANYRSSTKTDAAGRFRIASAPAGALNLVARGQGHLPVLRTGVFAQPGQVLDGIRLVASSGAAMRVTVVGGNGEPVGGASLRISRAPDAERPHLARLPPLAFAETDAEGTAVVRGLRPGTVTVDATHAAFAAAPTVTVVVPDAGEIRAQLTLRTPGFAAIQVLTAEGAVSAHESLRITGPAMDGRDGPSRRATADAEGRALVGPLAPGDYTIRLLRSSRGASLGDAVLLGDDAGNDIDSSADRFRVAAGETTRVELRRPVLAIVHGVVTGTEGPVPGCVVALAKPGTMAIGIAGVVGRSVMTDAGGHFSFDDVGSGTYTLRYGRPEQAVQATTDLVVPPGRREVRHDLALLTGRLRVQVCAAGSGAPVDGADVELIAHGVAEGSTPAARGDDASARAMGVPHARSGEQGWVEIDRLPVGDYTLQVRHERFASVTTLPLSIFPGRTTAGERVELTRAGQIRGRVLMMTGVTAGLVLVESRPAGRSVWSAPEACSDGSFCLSGLPGGRHLVRARVIGDGRLRCSSEVAVEVEVGATSTVDLELPQSGSAR